MTRRAGWQLGWRAGWCGRLLRLHSPGAEAFGLCWCQRGQRWDAVAGFMAGVAQAVDEQERRP